MKFELEPEAATASAKKKRCTVVWFPMQRAKGDLKPTACRKIGSRFSDHDIYLGLWLDSSGVDRPAG
jgi:hypothetical protein